MNVAKILILGVGLVASLVVYLLMRHPQLRREQFRNRAPFSISAALLCAAAVLGLFAFMAHLQ